MVKNIEGLNSRLRSLSIRRSHENDSDSAANQYQMKIEQNNASTKRMSREASVTTLMDEMQ